MGPVRTATRWAVFVAAVATCAVVAYGAYSLAQVSWNAVVEYRSPYAAVELPETTARSAEVSRTVLVIIDGLRLDASRRMGTLEGLRRSGRDMALVAPQPSLSYPNWTTIVSGAPPYVSGVVTNWHEVKAPVETLFDTARRAGVRAAFIGPEDFHALYGVGDSVDDTFMLKWDEEYLTDRYVDEALRIAQSADHRLMVVHLPDVDEAGHAHGGASDEYATAVRRVDADLGRLVNGLQDGSTVFVVVADHGHIDTGGHGGWEPSVIRVPGVVAGPGVELGQGEADLEDVAPTVAALAGLPVPRQALGRSVLADTPGGQPLRREADARLEAAAFGVRDILGTDLADAAASPAEEIERAQQARLAADRRERLPLGLLGAAVALAVVALVGVASRQALVAAFAGTVAYLAIYNGLFFLVHGYRWSFSAFNSEDRIEAWMNGRLVEAAIATLLGVVVAAAVYPLLRRAPKGPRGEYLAGWLTLGPATALVVLAVLGLQVAWFVWWWGVVPEWRLPDLMWGFKYDLDLIQATAVGFSAVLSPLVSYLVGRYHPYIRTPRHEG